ncbi:MAG: GNAT family N-acetyltransferase [Acidobacteria bacterium]|nr:GNAT family N-acetyltransferase [Acidobacteriota bacterium]
MTDASITIAILDGTDDWAQLRDAWTALYHRCGVELSLSHAWTSAVAALYTSRADHIRTVVLRRGDELVGLFPLITRTRRRAYRHLTPVAEEHSTHSDWLVAESSPEVAEALVEGLMAIGLTWDRFRMSRLLRTHPLLPHVLAALRRRGLRVLLRAEPPSYVLPLPRSFDAYLADRSAKFRNHLKRVHKKLEAHQTEVTVIAGDTDAAMFGDTFERILAIEQTSWKHWHQWAMEPGTAAAEFWRRVCASAWADGRLHVQWLTIDGRAAAYNLGYLTGRQYAYLKTTFSDEFRELGAATYLRARLIEDLIARGVERVDFPGEPYAWERQWTNDVREHVMLTAYSGTARSRILEALERVRHFKRQMVSP